MKKGVRGTIYLLFVAIIAIAYFGANLIVSDANENMYDLADNRSMEIYYKSDSNVVNIKYKYNNGSWIDTYMEKDINSEEDMFVYKVNVPNQCKIIAFFYDDKGNIDNNNGEYYVFDDNINFCKGK